jgi:RND family efflux transporter MFP subunit
MNYRSLLLPVFLLACQQKNDATAPVTPVAAVEEAAVVEVAPVKKQTLDVALSLTGVLRAKQEVDVAPKTGGRLAAVLADIGTEVKVGQTLATFENREIALMVKQAEAQLASAEAAKEQSVLDVDRIGKLQSSGASTEVEFAGLKTKKAMAVAGVDTASAALALAKESLSNSYIFSPIKGVVTRRMATLGQMAAPGMPLFTVHDTSIMKLEAGISERDLSKVKVGQKVEMRVDAYPSDVFHGEVTIIGKSLDPATRKLMLQIEFPNSDARLLSQMYARATLFLETIPEALVVPEAALVGNTSGSQPASEVVRSVWVEKDGVVSLKEIQVGTIAKSLVQVVSGLSEGDKVVLRGQSMLSDGKKVTVLKP